jgi:uncharacterized protein DUF1566
MRHRWTPRACVLAALSISILAFDCAISFPDYPLDDGGAPSGGAGGRGSGTGAGGRGSGAGAGRTGTGAGTPSGGTGAGGGTCATEGGAGGIDHQRVYTVTDAGIVDDVTHLLWQQTYGGPPVVVGWDAAVQYCTSQDGGDGGWRLPTLIELVSIVDYSVLDGEFPDAGGDAAIDPVFGNTPAELFWTSTTQVGTGSYKWYVHFGYGSVNGIDMGSDLPYVRCVHDSAVSKDDAGVAFVDDGGIYHDPSTQLDWQTSYVNGFSSYQSALEHCCTNGGFRLPTVSEFLTIVDLDASNPALDSNIFPGVPTGDSVFWSSTPCPAYVGYRAVDFFHGTSGKWNHACPEDFPVSYVRCVRQNAEHE